MMTPGQALAEEIQQEAAGTRKTLQRIPDEKLDWRPHDKSMSVRELASHIADCLSWSDVTFGQDLFEMDPKSYVPWLGQSTAEIVELFDKNAARAIETARNCPMEKTFTPWKMIVDGKTMLEMPRIVVAKSFLLNHVIHHRAQLGVYLRMLDVPVPAIYGPSADEQG